MTSKFRLLIAAGISLACLASDALTAKAMAEEKVLNIYNWSDYVAPDTVADFEKATGIKVNYELFDSWEMLYTKLLVGQSGFDIVFPAASMLPKLTQAHTLHELDDAALPNRKNLDPSIMALLAKTDPGNAHTIPYLRWTVGIAYNTDKIAALLPQAPKDSMDMLFDPANAAKLKSCGIEIIDSPDEVIGLALIYLGKDPNTENEQDLQAAKGLLLKLRPNVAKIASGAAYSDLASGEVCAAIIWSGDFRLAVDAATQNKTGITLSYILPKEGALLGMDTVAIPADAPHPGNAHQFLNYLMQPEVMAKITNYTHYANSNLAANDLVEAASKGDPVVYPGAADLARLATLRTRTDQGQRAVSRVWSQFRSGQ